MAGEDGEEGDEDDDDEEEGDEFEAASGGGAQSKGASATQDILGKASVAAQVSLHWPIRLLYVETVGQKVVELFVTLSCQALGVW